MNAQIILALIQMFNEFETARAKAREALSAQGVDLDRLFAEAKAENHKGIFDMIGGAPTPEPQPPAPPTPPAGEIQYNVFTTTAPDTSKLREPNKAYRTPDGRYYVDQGNFGIGGVPGPGWVQVWPTV